MKRVVSILICVFLGVSQVAAGEDDYIARNHGELSYYFQYQFTGRSFIVAAPAECSPDYFGGIRLLATTLPPHDESYGKVEALRQFHISVNNMGYNVYMAAFFGRQPSLFGVEVKQFVLKPYERTRPDLAIQFLLKNPDVVEAMEKLGIEVAAEPPLGPGATSLRGPHALPRIFRNISISEILSEFLRTYPGTILLLECKLPSGRHAFTLHYQDPSVLTFPPDNW